MSPMRQLCQGSTWNSACTRRDIAETPRYRPQDGPTRVLVFGGSQGSRAINDAVISGLEALASGSSQVRQVHQVHQVHQVQLIHQTGPAELDRVRDAYRRSPFEQYEVLPYIEDMAQAYRDSDIVVCRAGATTCAELAAAGRASILIPLTTAGGHQDDNAAMMAERGAARRLLEKDLSGPRLAEWILELAQDAGSRTTMAECARSLAKPDAAARVAERLELLARDGVRSP